MAVVARRCMLLATLEEFAIALGAMLAGAILLLLLGTQILDWRWLLLLGGIGSAIALLRVRRAAMSDYRVAQILDRRLHSHDLLSTAWFLLKEAPVKDDFTKAQIRRAEAAVPGVDARAIFPFEWKRSWSLVCALAAVAFGLFATRYLILKSLDLRYPLVALPAISARALERMETLLKPSVDDKNNGTELAKAALPHREGPQDSTESSQSQATPPVSKPDSGMNQSAGSPLGGKPGGQQAQGANSEQPDASATGAGDKHRRDARQPAQAESQSADARERNAQTSLSERMRDALSGLMEKMRPETARQESAQAANRDQAAGDSRDGQSAELNKNSQQGSSAENSASTASANRPQATEKSALAQNQAAEGASKKGSDSQSGIGHQDGAKDLREAEQLRAMGKLEEIIGKRSATLTGELTVETQSNHQQLQTQYSGRTAQHSDSGGLIQHDEVPLVLQNYVREYMELVHGQLKQKR